jgi:catechol 2,3-dioxygenase-like lactoylglutathione lyase family enzyme
MLTAVHPKLPMRDRARTKVYYTEQLGFTVFGNADHDGYLMLERDGLQIHFFEHRDLDPKENYGQVYLRTDDIEVLYRSLVERGVAIHPNGVLSTRPWGQKEFALLDPDHNLLTFGQTA